MTTPLGEAVPVLIVDDQSRNILAFEAALASPEYELVSVHSGQEAVEAVQRQEFAVVLMDVCMPDMDGIATARALRQVSQDRPTPVVLITAADTSPAQIHEAYYACGVVDFVHKPLEPVVIRAKVAVFAELFRARAKVTRALTEKRAAEEGERQLARERVARASSEAERKRLLSLLEQLPAIVNVLRGPELVFEFAHPRAAALWGGRELVGKPLLEAIPEYEEQREVPERIRQVYETGQPSSFHDVPVRRVGGEAEDVVYWDSTYLPILDAAGGVEGVMTFDLDVTESVRTRREMERINRAKDEFLATMSHELRTPLNAIQAWATALQKKPLEPKDLDRGLAAIERNVQTQTRLVSDLLDVSRIITGKLELRLLQAAIYPLITAAVDIVRPAADAKGVRLVVDVDPEMGETVVDPDRVQQIVWNLLSNAVRFTPRAGRVTVVADRTPSGIVIAVSDTGSGIAAQNLPHVFERFMQVDTSTTRAHGGLGLGLAIVRHLVEAHGGHVQAESPGPGQGATFTVQLPIRAALPRGERRRPSDAPPSSDAGAGAPDIERAPDLEGVRVLVVDDDPDSLEVLRMGLASARAAVTTAASAREAFEQIDTGGVFDLIISDIGMPEVDGYEFIRTLRARPAGPQVPAIALTAYARLQDMELSKKAGFQEHLTKPVNERLLLKAVKRWSRPAGASAPS